MQISEKIAYLRKQKGLSQEQLAIRLDVSRQAVYKWEANISQPEIDKLRKIARVFDISCDDLLDDSVDLSLAPTVEITEGEQAPVPPACEPPQEEKVEPKKPFNLRALIIILSIVAGVVTICSTIFFAILFSTLGDYTDDCIVSINGVTMYVEPGDKLSKPQDPQKHGYTFIGWYNGEKEWDFEKDTVKEDTSLVPKFRANINTLKINKNDGTNGSNTFQLATDEKFSLSENSIQRVGYILKGYSTTPNGDVEYTKASDYKMGAEDTTLYAIWQVREYGITYILNGGENSDKNKDRIKYNESLELSAPTKKGYRFDGWFKKGTDTSVTQLDGSAAADISIEARWTVINYKITYHLIYNGVENLNTDTYTINDSFEFNAPTKVGYEFKAWCSDKYYYNEITGIKEGTTGDIDVYAAWVQLRYPITYHLLCDEFTSYPTKEYYTAEDHFYLEEPTREDYDFVGWYRSPSLTGSSVWFIGKGTTGAMSLYAKWSAKTYTIKYASSIDSIGAEYPEDSTYTVNDYVELPVPTWEDHIFLGWYEDSALTKKITSIEIGTRGNKTLYPKWAEKSQFVYEKQNDNYVLVKYVGEDTTVTVPGTYDRLPVVGIAEGAFSNNTTVETVILSNVTTIEKNAFNNCTALKRVEIPSTTTSINELAFDGSNAITEFVVSSSNPQYTAYDGSLYTYYTDMYTGVKGCRLVRYAVGKTSTTYKAPTEASLTKIFPYAFKDARLTSVILDDGIGAIEKYAFYNCTALSEIDFGVGVDYIGASAFENCQSLKSVELNASKIWSIGNYAFKGCKSLTRVSIVGDISGEVGYEVLADCTSLESFSVNGGCKALGTSTFKNCTSLTSVVFPSGIEEIGSELFYGCTALKQITIPQTAVKIMPNAFLFCNSLSQVDFESDNNWYAGQRNLTSEEKSNGQTLAKLLTEDCSAFKWQINEPASVDKEIKYTYSDKLGGYVLTYIGADEDLLIINDSYNGKPIVAIGEGVAANHINLTTLSIGANVKYIYASAFINCSALAHINISDNVEFIGKNAFLGCDNIEDVYMRAGYVWLAGEKYITITSENAKAAINENQNVEWHRVAEEMSFVLNQTEDGYILNYVGKLFEEVEIPSEYKGLPVVEIATGAFKDCTRLAKVRLGDNVKTVRALAFENCPLLTEIAIPVSVIVIEKNAFYGVKFAIVECDAEEKQPLWQEDWIDESLNAIYYGELPCVDGEGHEWGEWTAYTEPNCEEPGYSKRTCTKCMSNQSKPSKMSLGTSHKWGMWRDTYATCTTGEYTERTCDSCGKVERRELSGPLGHSYTIINASDGVITKKCSRCYSSIDCETRDWLLEENIQIEGNYIGDASLLTDGDYDSVAIATKGQGEVTITAHNTRDNIDYIYIKLVQGIKCTVYLVTGEDEAFECRTETSESILINTGKLGRDFDSVRFVIESAEAADAVCEIDLLTEIAS
ncbi:MAG: leucine-rich repeat protein [Clostridia bacterium]|nr:leucine-rich repeat protein [Clostridia bacterium]